MLLVVSGSAVAGYPPNSGYPSAAVPYFDFELGFLVAAATQIEIQSQKWFVQHPMRQVWTQATEIAMNDFVPQNDCRRKNFLLVVFFHHRALLLLPPLSYSTNIGCSRPIFSCLGLSTRSARHGLH